MDQKKNSEQATDFCEAVDDQMKSNKEFHEKVKQERILKNDSKEQMNRRNNLRAQKRQLQINNSKTK